MVKLRFQLEQQYLFMKQRISVTLSADVLSRLDRMAGSKHSRSAVVESILRDYFRQRARTQAQARDLKRINKAAEQLNAEAEDSLDYQS
jgi:metal-responsive CopG/Arc/MetJ family transcriptional regulator